MKLSEINLREAIGSTVSFMAVMVEEVVESGTNGLFLKASFTCEGVTEEARFWDIKDVTGLVGTVVEVTAKVKLFRDNPSLNGVEIIESAITPELLLCGDMNRERTLSRFAELMEGFQDKCGIYYSITSEIMQSVLDSFMVCGAGKSYHHAYVGGLVEHIVDVTDIALSQMDSDLVRAGALLHDIGKVVELSTNLVSGKIDYTVPGSMLGHHSIGCSLIDATAIKLYGSEIDLFNGPIMLLKHIILSHHGTAELGSPIEPGCLEAYTIHQADMRSCKVFKHLGAVKNLEVGEISNVWEAGGYNKYYKVD